MYLQQRRPKRRLLFLCDIKKFLIRPFIHYYFSAIIRPIRSLTLFIKEKNMRTYADILLFGSFPLPWWGYLLYTLFTTHVTIISVTVYLHRTVAHRALDLHQRLELFFRFWIWVATGMIRREWGMIHRYHHAKNDGPLDPHSPWVHGIWKTVFLGVVLYYRAARNRDIWRANNCQDIKDDWHDEHVFSRPEKFARFYGVGLMLIIDITLFGAIGFLIWIIQMLWIPFWAAGVINGLGHWPSVGYRNFDTEDKSTNLTRIGAWIGGEELHNNHHKYPKSAKLSVKPDEFDIGWMYIRIFEFLGLAKVKYIHDQDVSKK